MFDTRKKIPLFNGYTIGFQTVINYEQMVLICTTTGLMANGLYKKTKTL